MTAQTLSSLDLLIIVLYAAGVLLIGFCARSSENPKNFLIADRSLRILSAVATINASKTGSILLIFTAFVYSFGFSAIWYFVGMSLGYLLFIPFALKLFDLSNSRYYTLSDYYNEHYGRSAAKTIAVVCATIMFISLLLNMIAATKVLSLFSGMSYVVASPLIGVIVLIYLLSAGFRAVVLTDLFQYLAIVVILASYCYFLFEPSKIPLSDWRINALELPTLIGFLLLGVLLPFSQPDLWQRVYSIHKRKDVSRSLLLSTVVHFFVAVILTLVALGIKTSLPNIDPDIALVQGFATLLPVGTAGLSVVVLFSAMMSSIDTYAFTATSCLVQDLFPSSSERVTVKRMRKVLALVIILATVLAIAFPDLVGAALILSAFIVLIAITTVVTWLRPEISARVLNRSVPLSVIALSLLIAFELLDGSFGPTIILKSIGISLSSLMIFSLFQKKGSSKGGRRDRKSTVLVLDP